MGQLSSLRLTYPRYSTMAGHGNLVRFEGAQQQEARMIKVYFSLDLEQIVLILIVARVLQRLL